MDQETGQPEQFFRYENNRTSWDHSKGPHNVYRVEDSRGIYKSVLAHDIGDAVEKYKRRCHEYEDENFAVGRMTAPAVVTKVELVMRVDLV